MYTLAEESERRGLKVGVGLMSRHARPLQELHARIQDGEIGDIIVMRGYRMHGPVGSAFSTKWPGKPSELLWQIRNFHSFLWASGGAFSDFYIHNIDECCWMKDAWPVEASWSSKEMASRRLPVAWRAIKASASGSTWDSAPT